jgi:Glycosyltransferase family 92
MAFGNLTSRSKKQTPNHHSHGVPTGTSQRQQYRGGGIIGVVTNNSNSGNRSHHHHHRSTTMPVLDKYNRGGRLSCCRSVLSKVLAFFVLMAAVYALYTRYVRLVVVVTHDAPETHHSTGFFTATTATPPIQIKTVATPIPLPKTNEFAEKVRVDTIRSIQTVDLDGADGVDGPEQQSEDEEGANVVQDTNGKVRRDRRSQDDDTDEIPNIEPGLITKQQQQPEEEEESEQQDAKLVVADGHMGDLPLTIKPQGFAFSTFEDFERHRTMSEAAMKHDVTVLRKVITAYMEPPLQDTVPNTGSRGDLSHNAKDKGVPPDFVIPLPRRTHTPNDLLKVEYPAVQTCQDMPGKFPVDRGLEIDSLGQVVVWNVGNTPTPPDFPEKEAQHCPVELDPFLPWIHDVFPSQDGSRIEFIAQNKRRCRTGAEYSENVNRLVPQVALMQPVSVEKISETKARELAPDLWQPETNHDSDDEGPPRYRLAPHEEASPNGMYTRFICRFHMTTAIDGAASVTVALGETLSEFPFNYEYINYRKDQRSLLSPKGKDTILFWTSNIRFSCPMPDNAALRHAVANGKTVLANGTPTVYVDVIPIRTSVRYNKIYLTEDMIGPKSEWGEPIFDPVQRWGPENVLPRVEASGRWANIPICLPPELVTEQTVHTETEMDAFDTTAVTRKLVPNIAELPTKPHFLVGCLWASAEFKTRGKDRGASTDTIDRLQEWIEFHLMVGFDHIYVYDNSGAHTNETSLEPTISLYPGKVTRIDWPSIVCNNNIPAHDSTGERSSQYAAENSCRTYVITDLHAFDFPTVRMVYISLAMQE